ncbi:hypothetical protein [Tepidibacter thalassicus]|uniref:Holin n=1 Tax=Tepidibacter thalassicus DSM 15285 TaxID=1123350 RepID=A0A1M5PVP2_9FIRM|nr:hypothetical protein [Tepidibacter thalassicus]SHH05720.1 hypothetical protein SAMN02744040_00623 [Tepidibacter thalassicus DSM 15285]
MDNKFRNYGLWVSILAFIPILADSLKVYDINIILPGNYETLTKAFLSILIIAGIISNPKEGKWFLDDKKEGAENE